MEKRFNIFQVFKNEGQLKKIYCYPSYKVINDPYEQTKTESFLNPIPIKGIVIPVSAEALRRKYFGQIPVGSVKIIVEKKYESIFRTVGKIKIDKNYYKVYFTDEQGFALLSYDNYIVLICQMVNL